MRCWIDDFGTGYSSISYLHESPVRPHRALKHPRPGRRRSPEHSHGQGRDRDGPQPGSCGWLPRAWRQRRSSEFLEKHDCDEVQGFLYSRPLQGSARPAFLGSRAAMTPAGRRRVPKMAAVAPAGRPPSLTRRLSAACCGRRASSSLPEGALLPFDNKEEEKKKGRHDLMVFSMAGILLVPVMLGLGRRRRPGPDHRAPRH